MTLEDINIRVVAPPLILIVLTILCSQVDHDWFSTSITSINRWILEYFGFLFSWSSFLFLFILLITYFSPLAKTRIGGANAQPLLSKPKWLAISICTTIATGILFWGCAEPLYHYNEPPIDNILPLSDASKQFAMSTMYMHWSFTPYAIYCLAGLVFAISFYNNQQKFSVSSLITTKKRHNTIVHDIADIVCLYALVLGMSASLGAGIYSIIGGLEEITTLKKSNTLVGIVGLVIIASFIVSAISGLQRGIKWLSTVNIVGFVLIAAFVLFFSYPIEIGSLMIDGLKEYVTTFIPRSTNIGSSINEQWQKDWSIFYWANWFAWAPIAALFLGRISKGYTVRQFIHFNLLIPSIFAIAWMSIFCGATLHLNHLKQNTLYDTMKITGEESVMYKVLNSIEYGSFLIPVTLFLIFLSYVTAADSNISAMSKMSEKDQDDQDGEASLTIKIIWGSIIGTLTYVMLATKGIDGIRILSVLGGFPAMFIIIGAAVKLIFYIFSKTEHSIQ